MCRFGVMHMRHVCRKLESQLEHTQLLLSETRTEHAALRQQHADTLNTAMKDTAAAAAARLAARDTERELRKQLAAAQADVREARADGAAALADGTERLQHDVETLRRCALATKEALGVTSLGCVSW